LLKENEREEHSPSFSEDWRLKGRIMKGRIRQGASIVAHWPNETTRLSVALNILITPGYRSTLG
jgi:hypothetical protein